MVDLRQGMFRFEFVEVSSLRKYWSFLELVSINGLLLSILFCWLAAHSEPGIYGPLLNRPPGFCVADILLFEVPDKSPSSYCYLELKDVGKLWLYWFLTDFFKRQDELLPRGANLAKVLNCSGRYWAQSLCSC